MSSTPLSYFESMYGATPDPWHFETSAYERRKYALTMASLPKRRYKSAFEPGCSIGVLTEMLASRCQRLLAVDMMESPVELARKRLAPYQNVRVEQRSIPTEWPKETFDLIVLSEIGYYFDEKALLEIMNLVVGSSSAGAHVVAVHWRGETEYPLSGDRTHELMDESEGLTRLHHYGEEAFILDVWERSV